MGGSNETHCRTFTMIFFGRGRPPGRFTAWTQGRHTNTRLVAFSTPRSPTLSGTVCPSPLIIGGPVWNLSGKWTWIKTQYYIWLGSILACMGHVVLRYSGDELSTNLFFVKGTFFWGKGGPPVLEEPARDRPHPAQGFVRRPHMPHTTLH